MIRGSFGDCAGNVNIHEHICICDHIWIEFYENLHDPKSLIEITYTWALYY